MPPTTMQNAQTVCEFDTCDSTGTGKTAPAFPIDKGGRSLRRDIPPERRQHRINRRVQPPLEGRLPG